MPYGISKPVQSDRKEQLPPGANYAGAPKNQGLSQPEPPHYDQIAEPEYKSQNIKGAPNRQRFEQSDQSCSSEKHNDSQQKIDDKQQNHGILYTVLCCGLWSPLCFEGCCSGNLMCAGINGSFNTL